jgi:hypothetical protein
VPSHFTLGRIGSPAEPPHELHGSALPQKPGLGRDGVSAASGALLEGDIKRLSEIASPTGVNTEVVSRIGRISFGCLDEILLGLLCHPANRVPNGQGLGQYAVLRWPMSTKIGEASLTGIWRALS